MARLIQSFYLVEYNCYRQKPYKYNECDQLYKKCTALGGAHKISGIKRDKFPVIKKKKVQRCGYERIHMRWKPYKCVKVFTSGNTKKFILDRNITNVIKVIICLASSLNGLK